MLLLLLVALLPRLGLPSGWMPAADGRSIVFCTGMGTKTLWVDADGQTHEKQPVEKTDQPCAFAGLGALLLTPATDAAASDHPAPAPPLPAASPSARIGQGLAAPPPPATGPPATA